MRNLRTAMLAGLGLAWVLCGGQAHAESVLMGTVQARLNAVSGSNGNVQVSLNNGAWMSEWAGMFTWTRNGGTHTAQDGFLELGQNFNTFCIEITEVIYLPSQNTYTLVALSGSPTDGDLGVRMGATKANLLRELWAQFFSTVKAGTDAQKAGFQLAVWEIVDDTGLNLTNGWFQAKSSNSAITSAASTYLSWLADNTGQVAKAGLAGMTFGDAQGNPVPNQNLQDQVVEAFATSAAPLPTVPLPPAAWAGVALMGVMGLRKLVASRRVA